MTYLKYILLLAVVIALGLGFKNVVDTYHQRDDLLTKNTALAKANASLKGQLDFKNKQGDVSHAVEQNTATQLSANDTKVKAIDTSVAQQTQVIIRKYSALPNTDANQQAKDAELSALNLKSLWQTFCDLGNTSPVCSTLKQ